MTSRKPARRKKVVETLVGTPRPTNTRNKHLLSRWMMANPTQGERLFLEAWNHTAPNKKIKPQAVLLGFIADFYFRDKKLVLEIDGAIHRQQLEYDQWRDEIFRQRGFNVLRISTDFVVKDPVGAVSFVLAHLRSVTKPPFPGTKVIRIPKLG